MYFIDTGINHVEFEGRASWGTIIPRNDVVEDGNGHGTHRVSTIGYRKYEGLPTSPPSKPWVPTEATLANVAGGVLWVAE